MWRRSSEGRDNKGAPDNNDIDESGPLYYGCDMIVIKLVKEVQYFI